MSLPILPGFGVPPAAPPSGGNDGRFKPGVSGNAGGRPKSVGEVRRLAREQTAFAIQTLVWIAANPMATDAARVAAVNSLLDRGYGKPVQPVAVGLQDQFEQLADDELEEYVQITALKVIQGGKE